MTSGRDDDALSWGGDDDPTLDHGARRRSPEETDAVASADAAPEAFVAAQPGDRDGQSATAAPGEHLPQTNHAAEALESAPAAPLGNAMLVALGVVGGIFALYTIGWIVGGLRLDATAQYLVSPVVYQVALWLAVAAPALWFATVHLLTRGSRPWVRLSWLAAGVALLVPWPILMTGAM